MEIASCTTLIAAARTAGEPRSLASASRNCAKRKRWLSGSRSTCRRSRRRSWGGPMPIARAQSAKEPASTLKRHATAPRRHHCRT
ncbi:MULTISPECIES: hypothetical protein [unclassified Mesorhizobium]|uniref:hypothetical protein n=1 Tax=unclassified Mesorhizobium TaxID=325217 RepID=UPI001FE1ADBF|nr:MULTISPECIES: hypothetical protein [unclassified Mesorhizobium]